MSAFAIAARDAASSSARSGSLATPHSVIETPCFLPVGTRGAVKGVEFDRLEEWDCRAVLANTYHLMVRPGIETIRRAGGLHAYMGWSRAILTDSGGFQVMSLAKLRKIDADGVTFQSHIDGSSHRLTPVRSIEIQHQLDAGEQSSPADVSDEGVNSLEIVQAFQKQCAHRPNVRQHVVVLDIGQSRQTGRHGQLISTEGSGMRARLPNVQTLAVEDYSESQTSSDGFGQNQHKTQT